MELGLSREYAQYNNDRSELMFTDETIISCRPHLFHSGRRSRPCHSFSSLLCAILAMLFIPRQWRFRVRVVDIDRCSDFRMHRAAESIGRLELGIDSIHIRKIHSTKFRSVLLEVRSSFGLRCLHASTNDPLSPSSSSFYTIIIITILIISRLLIMSNNEGERERERERATTRDRFLSRRFHCCPTYCTIPKRLALGARRVELCDAALPPRRRSCTGQAGEAGPPLRSISNN